MKEVSFDTQIDRLTQIIAEDTYSKHNIRRELKVALEENINKDFLQATIKEIDGYLLKEYYASKNARIDHIRHISAEDLMLDVLSILCTIIEPTTIQNPSASIGMKLEYADVFDGVKTAAELITLCARTGIVRIFSPGDYSESLSIQSLIKLDQPVLDLLQRVRYPNPMTCQPITWNNNIGGGYITSCDSVLLGKHTYHNDYQATDALNILQDISWELDNDVLIEPELPSKPMKTPEEAIAFKVMTSTSLDVYEEMANSSFWFQWQFDFRGRAYSRGYYINLQSSEYKKALLNFTKKEKVR